jgi:hypothetical protein
MAKPSVKGSIFKGVIDDLARLIEEKRVSQERVDAKLHAEDLAFLETEINPAAWYPMESYARLMQVLGEIEGGGKDAYFVERGSASARRLMASGLYQQLAFLSRWDEAIGSTRNDPSALLESYARNLRMVMSMASGIYSVGRWTVEPDPEHPGRVSIAVRDASVYSEPMRLAIEGFLNECGRAARQGLTHLYTSERPAPDVMLFRMTRDVTTITRP